MKFVEETEVTEDIKDRKGAQHNSIEHKLLNLDYLKKVLVKFNLRNDKEIKKVYNRLFEYVGYPVDPVINEYYELVAKKYELDIIKAYELGLLDGIKLSYEIKEK